MSRRSSAEREQGAQVGLPERNRGEVAGVVAVVRVHDLGCEGAALFLDDPVHCLASRCVADASSTRRSMTIYEGAWRTTGGGDRPVQVARRAVSTTPRGSVSPPGLLRCVHDLVCRSAGVKAVRYERYGSPDVLHVEDVPVPVPATGQVRVRVVATSVNLSDWECLRGSPAYARIGGLRYHARRTLGSDIAGVV